MPTPWGFELEDVFGLMRERRAVRTAWVRNTAERHRRDAEEYPCAYPHCPNSTRIEFYNEKRRLSARLCPHHNEQLRKVKILRNYRSEMARLPERIDALERRFIRRIANDLRAEEAERVRDLAVLARARATRQPGIRRAFVYRLYSQHGELLYVGKTYSLDKRFFSGYTAHAQVKYWWPQVAEAVIETYLNDIAALEAEAWAIRSEAPLHNIALPIPHLDTPPKVLARYRGEPRTVD